MSHLSFDSLDISEELHRATRDMGFLNATEIQAKTLPLILDGKDVIGRSQTGTGKTAAFSIPAIEMIDPMNKRDVQVLVVCPTRELAMQSHGEIKKLYKYKSGVKAAAIYGGQHILLQIRELKKGVNIVIGTPGRIMDHMRRGTLKLGNLKIIVLDEADEMLNMGFREDIETILAATPETRQTVMFCATMPPAIMALTRTYQTDPQLVEVNKNEMTLAAIEQFYCEVPQQKKREALMEILKKYDPKMGIIFSNTQRMVDELCAFLNENGYEAEGIHGNMRQHVRSKVMGNFKTGKAKILVATDVAARGIDAPNVEVVINYDIPTDIEYYIHRIGRTGRAGKSGKAITIISGRGQMQQLRMIERVTKVKITPENVEVAGKTIPFEHKQALAVSVEHIHVDRPKRQEFSSAPRIHRDREKREDGAPHIHGASIKEKREPTVPKGNTAFIEINIGKEQRVAPNHIVGAIAERTSLSGGDIGKITIGLKSTTVGIPASKKGEVVEALKGSKIMGLFITAKHLADKVEEAGDPFKFPKFDPRSQKGKRK